MSSAPLQMDPLPKVQFSLKLLRIPEPLEFRLKRYRQFFWDYRCQINYTGICTKQDGNYHYRYNVLTLPEPLCFGAAADEVGEADDHHQDTGNDDRDDDVAGHIVDRQPAGRHDEALRISRQDAVVGAADQVLERSQHLPHELPAGTSSLHNINRQH